MDKDDHVLPINQDTTLKTLHGIIELYVRAEKKGMPENCTKALTDLFAATTQSLGFIYVIHGSPDKK